MWAISIHKFSLYKYALLWFSSADLHCWLIHFAKVSKNVVFNFWFWISLVQRRLIYTKLIVCQRLKCSCDIQFCALYRWKKSQIKKITYLIHIGTAVMTLSSLLYALATRSCSIPEQCSLWTYLKIKQRQWKWLFPIQTAWITKPRIIWILQGWCLRAHHTCWNAQVSSLYLYDLLIG